MILWVVLTLMTVVAAVGLTIPLVRRYDRSRQVASGADVLGEQLQSIAAEPADVAPADVESLRADIGRRLISEAPDSAPSPRPLSGRGLVALGIGLVAVIGVAVTVLYAKVGRPDLATSGSPVAASTDAANPASPHQGMDPAVLIGQLETRMRQTPNDLEGWRMLGWSYMRVGRYADAANVYAKALTLDPGNGEFLSAQGEALTQAAGGQVTPAAETAFQGAVAKDKDDPRARFFLALDREQHGDHATAMAEWTALLKSAPPGAPWVADVRAAVERIATRDGANLSAKLPAPAPSNGPTADQVAAAQQASPADQAAMIQSMVGRLDARLKANPRDADGWIQLMRARMVLGDSAAAAAAYRRANAAYADSTTQRAAFKAAATDLQIPGV